MVNASIVLYKNKKNIIEKIINDFFKFGKSGTLFLIDNSPTQNLKSLASVNKNTKYIFNGENLGYGSNIILH